MSELSTEQLRKLAEIAGRDPNIVHEAVIHEFDPIGTPSGARPTWQPYIDIAQAFEVIEGMRKRGFELDIKADQSRDGAQPYGVEFFRMPPDGATGYAIVNTAPMAICLAALKSQEADQ